MSDDLPVSSDPTRRRAARALDALYERCQALHLAKQEASASADTPPLTREEALWHATYGSLGQVCARLLAKYPEQRGAHRRIAEHQARQRAAQAEEGDDA